MLVGMLCVTQYHSKVPGVLPHSTRHVSGPRGSGGVAGGQQGDAGGCCCRACTCWPLAVALSHSTPLLQCVGVAAAALLSYRATCVIAQSTTDMCGSGAVTGVL